MYKLIFLLLLSKFSHQQQPEWNYFTGGNDWPPEWPSCSSTKYQQSPIDIKYKKVHNITQAILHFDQLAQNVITQVENNGYFLKSDFPWMRISVNDNTGKVRQAQCFTVGFHAPSEHVIEGNRFNMEIQFSCEDLIENGKFINLAIFCESQRFEVNQIVEKFASAATMLKKKGDRTKIKLQFEQHFLNALQSNQINEYYTYEGTFTSPPCHHSVTWIILSKPMKISDQTLSQFQALWAANMDFAGGTGNYRNLQIFNQHTKIMLGNIQQSLTPLDITAQIYKKNKKKNDKDSDDYYQQKIDHNLKILEEQRAISSYSMKAKDKLNYLTKKVDILTNQQNEATGNDKFQQEQFANKLKEAQQELQTFKTNCMEYHQDSECDLEIPNQQNEQQQDQQMSAQQKDEANQQSQELSETGTLEPEKQVMRTHDGQEVEMKVPEDLQFLQIAKKKYKGIQKNQ